MKNTDEQLLEKWNKSREGIYYTSKKDLLDLMEMVRAESRERLDELRSERDFWLAQMEQRGFER